MKIVINTKFGGFGLSANAKRRIAELGCGHYKFESTDEYFRDNGSQSQAWESIWNSKDEMMKTHLKMCFIPLTDAGLIIDRHRDYEARMCPQLIRVVEEMGSAVNTKYAELKIVEIPDGIEWEIDEYDGVEAIHEKHRSWR
ncbi:MAG: hypothetical protein ACRD5H_07300 [Nitrososphaerales archaeon]